MPFLNSLGRDQLLKLVLLAALATGVLVSVAGRGTLAYFTTQVTSTGNQFSAGNLHFNITDNNQTNQTTVASSITLSNMKPGDVVYAPITVKNIGTIDAQWGIQYAATAGTSDLGSLLQIALVGRGTGSATAADCVHTGDLTDNAVWAEQIAPSLAALQASGTHTYVDATSTVVPATNGAWVPADATAGAHLFLEHATGTLDTDVLCVEVKWPDGGTPGSLTTGDNAYNAASASTWSTTILFTFDGEQLNRNVNFDQQAGPTSGNY